MLVEKLALSRTREHGSANSINVTRMTVEYAWNAREDNEIRLRITFAKVEFCKRKYNRKSTNYEQIEQTGAQRVP